MYLILLIGGLLLGSVMLWLGGRWLRQRLSGNPFPALQGQLVSLKFGITGKPDLILAHNGYPIPVITKQGQAPKSPHDSHVAQILVHCLLIEETTQTAPPYGVIRYDNRTFEVDYDDQMYEMLLDLLEEMHHDRAEGIDLLPRSHRKERRCAGCRHRKKCDEKLIK